MVDQATKLNRNGERMTPSGHMGRNVSGLAHDLMTLVELQYQLLMADLKAGVSRAIVPVAAIAVGAILVFIALLMLVSSVALVIQESTDLTAGAAFAITGGSAIVLAAILMFAAWMKLRSSFDVLDRSSQEFKENLRSIKAALKPPH